MSDQTRSNQIKVAANGFLTLFSIVGLALYGLPFYYDFMVKEFGWSITQVTSGNALSKLIVGPLFGFAAGWIIDRFGPRRLMIAGILIAGIAVMGLSSMSALWMFYFFYFLNALGYVCGGPLPNQVLLSRWFDAGKGKAMGLAYVGIGAGGTIVPLLSRWMISHFGWRGALLGLGAIMIAVALPMALIIKEPPPLPARRESGDSPTEAREVFRSGSFYLLAIGSMCSIGAVGGTNQHLKLYLSLDQHYSQGEISIIVSMVLAFSIAGRLLMGWLADRLPKKYVMLMIYSLVAAAIPLLFLASTHGTLYIFAAVFGLALGGEYLIIPLMAGELFGVKVLGRLMGVVLTADGIAEAMFPLLVGRLRDQTGDYRTGFALLIALALTGALAIVSLKARVAVPASSLTPTRQDANASTDLMHSRGDLTMERTAE
ncbi:MAG TPA: MFS transporter [Blastocatellia bacterium]|nr:MFS transporter [Blastocatellia bacterium]